MTRPTCGGCRWWIEPARIGDYGRCWSPLARKLHTGFDFRDLYVPVWYNCPHHTPSTARDAGTEEVCDND